MATKIFVNLPVKNLDMSMEFFGKLGFTFNKQFTDETAAAMVISEDIYAMLLTHEKFSKFTSKAIADATSTTEVINCLSFDTKEKVYEITDAAIKAGAKEASPMQDNGFMISRSINDLDGHTWEFIWMDPGFVQPQQ